VGARLAIVVGLASYPAPSGEYDSAATLSYAYSSALPTRHCSRGIVASPFGQAVAQLDAGHGQARLSVVVATLGLPSRGDVVAALREAVQPLKRRGEVINEGQLALGVTHRQQAPHRMAADNHPVDIAAHAAHADVVEGGEGSGAEEVDSGCTIRRPHSDFSNVTCRSVVVAPTPRWPHPSRGVGGEHHSAATRSRATSIVSPLALGDNGNAPPGAPPTVLTDADNRRADLVELHVDAGRAVDTRSPRSIVHAATATAHPRGVGWPSPAAVAVC
jgi:hypothetical protein